MLRYPEDMKTQPGILGKEACFKRSVVWDKNRSVRDKVGQIILGYFRI